MSFKSNKVNQYFPTVVRMFLIYVCSLSRKPLWITSFPIQSKVVGYDEFHSKLAKQEVQTEQFDPEKPLPVADLISGLLNRQLLPGCTVMVTCRLRNVIDLEGISDKVGQLLGWDCHEIKEYVDNFFGDKGKNMQAIFSFRQRDTSTYI